MRVAQGAVTSRAGLAPAEGQGRAGGPSPRLPPGCPLVPDCPAPSPVLWPLLPLDRACGCSHEAMSTAATRGLHLDVLMEQTLAARPRQAGSPATGWTPCPGLPKHGETRGKHFHQPEPKTECPMRPGPTSHVQGLRNLPDAGTAVCPGSRRLEMTVFPQPQGESVGASVGPDGRPPVATQQAGAPLLGGVPPNRDGLGKELGAWHSVTWPAVRPHHVCPPPGAPQSSRRP